MKRKMSIILGGVAVAAALSAAPAIAAPGDNGNGVGVCVDNLYGNATNPRPGGNGVLPSQSPGPWVNNGGFGPTVGDVHKGAHDLFGAPGQTGYTGRDVNQEICTFP